MNTQRLHACQFYEVKVPESEKHRRRSPAMTHLNRKIMMVSLDRGQESSISTLKANSGREGHNPVMDYIHQLHPLEVNAKTGEPFLRLKNHPNIILTPPRDDDASACVPYLNDARVSYWLGDLPFPYTVGMCCVHAGSWAFSEPNFRPREEFHRWCQRWCTGDPRRARKRES